LTTVQGVPAEYDLKRILKALKKVLISEISLFQDFACNGTVVKSEELGEVIQLQGDQRNKVFEFLSGTLQLKKKYFL
jgi:translation initiation factor 1